MQQLSNLQIVTGNKVGFQLTSEEKHKNIFIPIDISTLLNINKHRASSLRVLTNVYDLYRSKHPNCHLEIRNCVNEVFECYIIDDDSGDEDNIRFSDFFMIYSDKILGNTSLVDIYIEDDLLDKLENSNVITVDYDLDNNTKLLPENTSTPSDALSELQQQLDKAIEDEDFEEAEKIQNKIDDLSN